MFAKLKESSGSLQSWKRVQIESAGMFAKLEESAGMFAKLEQSVGMIAKLEQSAGMFAKLE